MIVNKFHEKTKLKVHCKSGNDDFPIIYLKNGQAKGWRFNDALFHDTVYKCELSHGYHFSHFQKFVAYTSAWNNSLKNKENVTWLAVERGLYRIFNHRSPEYMHKWM
ncbi:hypothetical protein EUTSA_v10015087mg [Eutrema salsugineum]|uniref:S-protein homolog n=1 Tax=Eutrema salsugineum TaxID=72664 RepID=V4L9J5_EUTSA|nr:hypothetical protein EUTSA_v10015087mg [Eutrema salsugineum]